VKKLLLLPLLALAFLWRVQVQVPTPLATASSGVEIQFIANEGYFVTGGGKKALVDALFREGVEGYDTVPPATRELTEQARAPFDKVDLALASHHHADHFDAAAVAAHLQNNPAALFVSTNQAVEKLKAVKDFGARARGVAPKEGERAVITHNGIRLEVFYLHHGRSRPVENLGLLFRVGGKKFLHIGDTEANAADFRQYNLPADKIDVAFVPYWFLLGEEGKKSVRENIAAKHVVPIHMPLNSDLDTSVTKRGGWDKVLQGIKKEFPDAIILRQVLEKATLE
jgi:L-ascorbate metabolism protein UlaG (beta-lactamase superfamily)